MKEMVKYLPFFSNLSKRFGKKQSIVIYAVVVLVVAFILFQFGGSIKDAFKKLFGKKHDGLSEQELREYYEESYNSVDDGIIASEDEKEAYRLTAKAIADAQHQAMNQSGTIEETLFSIDQVEFGWQLIMIAQEFGKRPYAFLGDVSEKNIFQWYDEELNSYWAGNTSENLPSTQNCSSEYDYGFFGQQGCTERELMRQIWKKSGIVN